jgi:hypothetical protein
MSEMPDGSLNWYLAANCHLRHELRGLIWGIRCVAPNVTLQVTGMRVDGECDASKIRNTDIVVAAVLVEHTQAEPFGAQQFTVHVDH